MSASKKDRVWEVSPGLDPLQSKLGLILSFISSISKTYFLYDMCRHLS